MRYLSDAWFEAADKAVGDASKTAPAGRVVIDQFVDDVSFRVCIDRHGSSITVFEPAHQPVEHAEPADATFTQSRATAAAVARGGTDAHQAFLLGRIRFHGNVDVLIERRDSFAWLEAVLAPVLAATTYDTD